MFKMLSLRLKIVLAFLLVTGFFVAVSVYQIFSMQQTNARFTQMVDQDMARLNALQEVDLALTRLADGRADYQFALVTKSADVPKSKQALVSQSNDFENKLHAYGELTKGDSGAGEARTNATILERGGAVVAKTRSLLASGHDLSATDQHELVATQTQLDQSISSAASWGWSVIQQQSSVIVNTNTDLIFTIAALTIITTIAAAVVGFVIASYITRSLAIVGRGAERIANGDFSQIIDDSSKDEIGQVGSAFNRMAQRLRESYNRLGLEQQRDDAILKGMGEGLVATDEERRIVVINKAAAELLELGDEAEINHEPIKEAYTLYQLGGKEDAKLPPHKHPSFMALTTGKQVEGVYGFKSSDGVKRQINMASSPFEVDGKVVGVVTILRDVTKEKEIDRMKTEFISLASHQLRTPLSAIKWFVEMLINGDAGKLNADQMDFATNISDSTQRMIELVNSLLNISRIESGRIMVVPQPTDLKELVNGITNDLKAKTEEKQQTLIISVHASLPKINLDPRLIGQVYLNLLTNAVKYTPKGGEISVFISKKGDQVISQVTDNGYGIPKEQQPRLFEKFFRASNAVKVETDGTGLGLYLIKAIIESSGGKIWFESEEGKGSTFWFSIPLSGMKAKEGEVTLDV